MAIKNIRLYFIIMLPLLGFSFLLLWHGTSLQPSSYVSEINNMKSGSLGLAENFKHPLTILLMQMIVVLFAAKTIGYLFTLIGQQSVIGETAAGIIIGPSLLGWMMPDVFAFIFPANSLSNLQLLSQIGLVLFMFIIGMELNIDILKKRATEALLVSHVSIFFPYLLGILLAYYLYTDFAPANIPFITYALFMGIAMSITAFPVLARILKERKLTQTGVGGMAIICAAIDDVTAWCILAIVISIAKAGNIAGALLTIVITILYVLIMFFVVRPALEKLSRKFYKNNKVESTFIAVILLMVILSAFIAEVIGIHALFGAFLAGVIMPSSVSLRNLFTEKVEDVSIMLLLPLFFAFTGLRTQIGLLNNFSLWATCGIIIAIAVFGKFFGSAVASRLVGQSWKDSLSIGALMNTRGLMEIIVLNIGYDLGILTPSIFTMMVFMALITTCMTAPMLNLIERIFK